MRVGQKFDNWTIISFENTQRVTIQCKCGTTKVVRWWDLQNSRSKSCLSCYHKQKIEDNLLPIGTKFGTYTVKSRRWKRKSGKTGGLKQHVQCDCGRESFLEMYQLKNKLTKSCPSCGSLSRKKRYEEISLYTISQLEKGALKRDLEYKLTNQFMWNQYLKQNRRCALSGVEINFNTSSNRESNRTASPDRIDSSKGYIESNFQWVHKIVNRMKMDLSDEEFIKWCQLIAKNNNQ